MCVGRGLLSTWRRCSVRRFLWSVFYSGFWVSSALQRRALVSNFCTLLCIFSSDCDCDLWLGFLRVIFFCVRAVASSLFCMSSARDLCRSCAVVLVFFCIQCVVDVHCARRALGILHALLPCCRYAKSTMLKRRHSLVCYSR